MIIKMRMSFIIAVSIIIISPVQALAAPVDLLKHTQKQEIHHKYVSLNPMVHGHRTNTETDFMQTLAAQVIKYQNFIDIPIKSKEHLQERILESMEIDRGQPFLQVEDTSTAAVGQASDMKTSSQSETTQQIRGKINYAYAAAMQSPKLQSSGKESDMEEKSSLEQGVWHNSKAACRGMKKMAARVIDLAEVENKCVVGIYNVRPHVASIQKIYDEYTLLY